MSSTNSDGTRIHYEVEGTGSALLLLHGTAGSTDDWRQNGYLNALKDGNRLVMVDQRGHGRSDKPHDVASYDWPLLVGDAVRVMDDLGLDEANVLGYSGGSFIALGMAMTMPARVHSLVLGGASPKWPGVSARMLELLASGMEAFVTATLEANGPLDPDFRELVLANDPAALSASLSASRCTPTKAMMRAFTRPTLLYAGEHDPRLADSAEMVTYLPDARLVTIPGLNHAETYLNGVPALPHIKAFLARVAA